MICLFALLDRPESTHSLNAMEQKLALARTSRGTSGDVGKMINMSMCISLCSAPRPLKQITGHVLAGCQDWRVSSVYLPLTGGQYFSGVCVWGALFRTLLCCWIHWSLPANNNCYHGL